MTNNNSIDWTLIIINTSIPLYLPKSDLINLILTSKLIQKKLIPILYNTIIIDQRLLSNQPNYFMEHIIEFLYNDSLSNLWLIAKNWFNKDAAFKEAHIDPYIKELNDQLKPLTIYCKSLYFEYLGNALYYLFPIAYKFQNLRTLYFYKCVFSLEQFSNILEKLTKLEVLDLKNIDIIKSLDSNSISILLFPQSLRSLCYFSVKSCSTTLPLEKPLEFLTTTNSIDITSDHSLLPQLLPKLKKLNYFSSTLEEELLEFLDINCQIDDLRLPIVFLSYIIPDQKFLTSLKKLNLYGTDIVSVDVNADKAIIPDLRNLEELKLYLNTNAQLEYAKLLIRNCPKLLILDARSSVLKCYKLRELIKFSKNLKYYNGERLY